MLHHYECRMCVYAHDHHHQALVVSIVRPDQTRGVPSHMACNSAAEHSIRYVCTTRQCKHTHMR